MDKLEREQEKELAELREELVRTKKSGEESSDLVVKLAEALRQAQRAREKVQGEVRVFPPPVTPMPSLFPPNRPSGALTGRCCSPSVLPSVLLDLSFPSLLL